MEKLERKQLGTFWMRVLAMIIDIIVVWSVTSTISLLAHQGKSDAMAVFGIGSADSWLDWVVIIVFWAYNVVMLKLMGATVGKLALGMKVVDKDLKSELDWLTVIVREVVGKTLSILTVGIGFLMVIWDDDRQALEDKVADTLVVREKEVK